MTTPAAPDAEFDRLPPIAGSLSRGEWAAMTAVWSLLALNSIGTDPRALAAGGTAGVGWQLAILGLVAAALWAAAGGATAGGRRVRDRAPAADHSAPHSNSTFAQALPVESRFVPREALGGRDARTASHSFGDRSLAASSRRQQWPGRPPGRGARVL